jgi:hypothetical protein
MGKKLPRDTDLCRARCPFGDEASSRHWIPRFASCILQFVLLDR